MKTFAVVILVPVLFTPIVATAQQKERVVLTVERAATSITIDGVLDEAAWTSASMTSPFLNKWPLDTGQAFHQTEVKMLFDNSFIYVAAKNYQKKDDLIIQ